MSYSLALPSNIGAGGYYTHRRTPSPSPSSGHYSPSAIDFVNFFYAVLNRWKSETAFYSNPDQITSHQSFRDLVENVDTITPLVIDELKKGPSLLVWVLEEGTGEKPYAESSSGNIKEMTNAWIAWAERNGRVI
jgi:hypothetical protein